MLTICLFVYAMGSDAYTKTCTANVPQEAVQEALQACADRSMDPVTTCETRYTQTALGPVFAFIYR